MTDSRFSISFAWAPIVILAVCVSAQEVPRLGDVLPAAPERVAVYAELIRDLDTAAPDASLLERADRFAEELADEPLALARLLIARSRSQGRAGRIEPAHADLVLAFVPLAAASRSRDLVAILQEAMRLAARRGRDDVALAHLARAEDLATELGDAALRAAIVLDRAVHFRERSRLTEAEAELDRAAALFAQTDSPTGAGLVLANRGVIHRLRGRFDESLQAYASAAGIFARAGDERMQSWTRFSRANVLIDLARFAEAITEYDAVLARAGETGDEVALASAHEARAVALKSLGRLDEAVAGLEAAKVLLEKRGDAPGLARLELNRATVLSDRGRWAEALAALAVAEPLFKRIGDRGALATIAFNRGEVFLATSRVDEALHQFAAAEVWYRESHNRPALADLAVNRGNAYATRCDYEAAAREYAAAGGVFEEVGDRKGQASVLANLGVLASALSRHGEAIRQLGRAAALFEAIGDRARMARLRLQRAQVLESLSRFDEALGELDRVAAVVRELGDDGGLALVAASRGALLLRIGRPEEALEPLRRAVRHYDAAGDRARSLQLRSGLGVALVKLGRDEEGDALFTGLLETLERDGPVRSLALALVNRGSIRVDRGRLDDALADYERAAKLFAGYGDRMLHALSLFNQGAVLVTLARADEGLERLSRAAAALAGVLARDARPIGESSSERLRGQLKHFASSALRALLDLDSPDEGDIASVLEVVETIHGLGMAESLAEGPRSAKLAVNQDDAATLRSIELRRRLLLEARDGMVDGMTVDADSLEANLRALAALDLDEARIVERYRLSDPARTALEYPRAAPLPEIRQAIPEDAILLHYLLEEDGVYCAVSDRASTRVFDLGDAASLLGDVRTLVAEMRTATGRVVPDPELLRRLGVRLLDPVLRAESGIPKQVLIAPLGEACRLPFEILLTADPGEAAGPAAWPYLVVSSDVSYVHSGTTLVALRRTGSRAPVSDGEAPRFFGLGFPFDEEAEAREAGREPLAWDDFDAPLAQRGARRILYGSGAEILAAARFFARGEDESERIDEALDLLDEDELSRRVPPLDGARWCVRLRTRATETELHSEQAKKASIIHLACHAEADLGSPSLSRLVLARSPAIQRVTGDDGYVYLYELKRLDLTADLVVLSACSTNDGLRSPVEGVTGLSRAFLAAGAGSVIATLWPVEDESAAALMTAFYRHHVAGGMGLIGALARAKREAIRAGLPFKTWSAYLIWDGGHVLPPARPGDPDRR